MSRMADYRAVPPSIQQKLASMLWRARVVAVIRGLAMVIASVLVAVLLAIGADHFLMGYVERYVIVYEWPVRLAVTLGIFAVMALVTALTVIRPLVRRFTDSGIAQTIEAAHPELEERLSSTVELLASRDASVLRGSDEMIGIVTDQADAGARGLNLRGIVSWDRAVRYWAMTGLIALMAAGIAYRWPEPFLLSLKRLFVANLERVDGAELSVVGQGDRVVPEGEPVMIQAEARGQPVASAWLLIRDKTDRLQSFKMASAEDHGVLFAHTIPKAQGTWRYQVRAGDSHTRWYTVRAVPRPDVMGLDVTVRPPDYSDRRPRTVKSFPETLKVLRHSRLELDVHTNKPVAYAVLEFDRDRPIELKPDLKRGNHYVATLTALDDTSFRVLLADEHKLDNVSPARYRVRVLRDEPPSVAITQPGRRVTLRAQDKLPILFAAGDDMAVTKAELIVTVGVDDPQVLPIKLDHPGRRRLDGQTVLDLGELGVLHARQVTYRVRVSDSLPGELDNGPQTATSAEHEVMIDAAAQSFKMQVLKSVRKEFQTALEQITQLLKDSQKQTAALKTAATEKQAYTPQQMDQTDTVRKTLRKVEKLAVEVQELTAYTDYRNLGRMLGQDVAKGHVAPAEQLVSQARLLANQHAERADRFGRGEFEIQRALEKLGALAKQFDDAAGYQETAQALADAAAQQAELAERIKRLSEVDVGPAIPGASSLPASSQPGAEPPPATGVPSGQVGPLTTGPAQKLEGAEPGNLAKLTDEQRDLIKKMQQMVAVNPDLWQPALELQQARSKTLLEQIKELADRQDALTKLVKEQETRDKAKTQRQALVKAQEALKAQAAALAKDHADRLKEAGAQPPDLERMTRAATEVDAERVSGAMQLQAESAAELGKIATMADAAAKKLRKGAPNPQPHQEHAEKTKALGAQATRLAQQQRHLAGETQKHAKQRSDQQASIAKADAQFQQQLAELGERQKALAAEASKLIERLGKHPMLSSDLAAALKRPEVPAMLAQADQQLGRKKLEKVAAAQQAAGEKVVGLGASVSASAKWARQEGKRLKTETAAWSKAEADRQKAVKAYQAEQARRDGAMKKWQADEAKRKAALAKWLADEQARRKADAARATTKPAATQPVKPTTTAPTTQRVAQPTTQQVPAPIQPPKALATPVAKPTFAPLTKPSDTPAPQPKPKRPLWTQAQLESADALAAETAAVAKRLQALQGQTAAAVKQVKQTQEQRAALTQQNHHNDENLLKQQEALRQEVTQLTRQASRAAPALAKDEASSPLPLMQTAAKAIRQHELASAPKPQTAAAERLEALAKSLQGETDKANAAAAETAKVAAEARKRAEAQDAMGKQVRQLHQQQTQLHKQTRTLARRLAPLGASLRDKVIADLGRQQQELAKAATELSDELGKPQQADGVELPAKPDPAAQAGAMAAQEAAKALQSLPTDAKKAGQPDADQAMTKASQQVRALQDQTADQLDRLVERLQTPLEPDPAHWEAQATEEYVRIQQAERAVNLADRQRRLARQLESAVAGKPMQAVAIEQTELRRKVPDFALAAEFLAEQVEAMEAKVPAMKPKIQANATKAAELLAKTAPAAMDAAAKALAEDQPSAALAPMGAAHKAVGEAHRLLGTLQAQMAKAASQAPAGTPSDQERRRRLTESLQDQYEALQRMLEAQQAAGDGTADPAEAAAQAMREKLAAQAARATANINAVRMQASAKEFLEAAWLAAGEQNVNPDEAIILPGVPTGAGNWRLTVPDSAILDFEVLGMTRSDWARLPETLREEVIQAAEDKAPAEYREVIKRYFKAIGQRAGKGTERPLLDESTRPKVQDKPEGKGNTKAKGK